MLYHRLRQLDQRGTPIQIGLIAAGTFGTQIASQLACAPGMRLAAIAELDLTKARRAYGRGQILDDQIDTADDPAAIDAAMEAGRYAVTVDAHALMESGPSYRGHGQRRIWGGPRPLCHCAKKAPSHGHSGGRCSSWQPTEKTGR